MMCYKDMTFCSAECENHNCFRQFTTRDREGARRWWSHDPDNAPVAFADFSEGCDSLKLRGDMTDNVMTRDEDEADAEILALKETTQ